MSLGTEQKNSQMGDQMSKLRTVIVKASYTAGSAPSPSNLSSVVSGALSGTTERLVLSGLEMENVDEIVSLEDLSSVIVFDGLNAVLPSASLQANNDIYIDAEAEDGAASAAVVFRLSYLVKF